ncbi:Hsp20/alpha crystallin family protein [Stutzerimonas stutzeri]|uniref:Hsp20/alpha crystallin family protein n=1 Tax=Stutzerimonas stutzeri TaxID=316 RepID=UPI003AF3CEBB
MFRKPVSSRISLDGLDVEEKDIQITPDNDVPMVRGESARSKRRAKRLSRVELPYGSFQCALNLPDDANQDSKR